MRKGIIIAVSVFLAITVAVVVSIVSTPRIQVVGSLSPDDLDQVLKMVRQELRFWILPKLEWDNIHHLDYVWRQVREYETQRILWVEVKPDGSVEVFAGVSKDVIRSEGHAIDLRKQPNWQITGYGYWGFSNAAPHDIHIPPSP